MDNDSWAARLSSASRRYQSALQSRSDMFIGFEDIEGDEDIREEFACPYCSDYFDIVGLCCHIDEEHPADSKNGVCPVCAMRVGLDMVSHITLQHGNIFKVQRRRKSRKAGSSTLSLLRKELREGNIQSLFGGSSCIVSSSNAAADPLLSSFILPMADDIINLDTQSPANAVSAKKSAEDSISERNVKSSPLSIKEQEEKASKSEFVHGLLFSTIFDDKL